jgi:hypothetical protein
VSPEWGQDKGIEQFKLDIVVYTIILALERLRQEDLRLRPTWST